MLFDDNGRVQYLLRILSNNGQTVNILVQLDLNFTIILPFARMRNRVILCFPLLCAVTREILPRIDVARHTRLLRSLLLLWRAVTHEILRRIVTSEILRRVDVTYF